MKKSTLWWIIGIIVIIVALFGWSKVAQNGDSSIVARNGLHWHPTLTIYVDGKKQEIPANVGLAGGHQPMHTHEEDSAEGVIHLEFGSVVRPDDLHLSNFFRIWNKDIMTAFGTLERMTVNGEDNAEYGDYQIQGEDNIELYYTTSPQSEAQSSGYKTIGVAELNDSLASKDFMLVNVHIPYTAEIEGTDAFVPYNEIAQNLDQLPRDKNEKIVLYCQSGNMSAIAAQTLTDLGYTNVVDVPGGMIEWKNQGYPLVTL